MKIESGETVTPEQKAKIYELFEQSNTHAEEQAEFIDELMGRLRVAESVCYTVKGYLAHGDDPLGAVYLDLLKDKLERWTNEKREGQRSDDHPKQQNY